MIIGAGAFSDSKLSLSCEVGGDLPSRIGVDKAQKPSATRTGLEFGADFHVEGLGTTEEVKAMRRRTNRAGLKPVDCPPEIEFTLWQTGLFGGRCFKSTACAG